MLLCDSKPDIENSAPVGGGGHIKKTYLLVTKSFSVDGLSKNWLRVRVDFIHMLSVLSSMFKLPQFSEKIKRIMKRV